MFYSGREENKGDWDKVPLCCDECVAYSWVFYE